MVCWLSPVLRMRALMRATGLSQHTIEKIRRGLPVRQATLRRVLATLSR
jgi:DNA-binding Xre family transcriptional regulator